MLDQRKETKRKDTRMPLSSLGTSVCLALRVLRMQIGYPSDLSCAPKDLSGVFRRGIPAPAENAMHPCIAPDGQRRSNPPVLGAAKREKTAVKFESV
ncbi:hypothetical protein [Methylomonas koyamae]|uniref:hypothetical protein n=1 Tax=Methylomonas koyamae TaxID=702114 RepID=UPI0012F667FA|nr:hypothetical protein [Methylomonas koyamae]